MLDRPMIEVCLENGLFLSPLQIMLHLRKGINMGNLFPFLIYNFYDKLRVSPIFSRPFLSLTLQVSTSSPEASTQSHPQRTLWDGWTTIAVFPGLRGILGPRTFSAKTWSIPGNWDKFVTSNGHLPLSYHSPMIRLPLIDPILKSLIRLWSISKHSRTLQQGVPCQIIVLRLIMIKVKEVLCEKVDRHR